MNKVFLIPDESTGDNLNNPEVAPFIDYVVDYLFNKYRKNDFWDMSNVVLVVPSARVRIETLEQILIRAEKENVHWEIPKIVTIGSAPEFFYRQTRPFADDVTQNLVWFQAIKSSDENKRIKFLPSMPGDDDLEGQFLLGQMFSRLHQSLSAEELSFADVAQKLVDLKNNPSKDLGKLNLDNEIDRWNYLSGVEEKYLSILDSHNLWDRQAARRFALKSPLPGDFVTNRDIVLAGIVDLNRVQKAILNRVKSHVTALIYAPESESDGFDKFGAIDVKYWSDELRCPLEDDQVIQVEKPEEQVLCAFKRISQLSDKFTPDDFTIGAPDDNLIPYIQSTAAKLGLQIDNTVGVPITSSPPYALLQAILEFMETNSFASFANLARHPSVYNVLSSVATGSRRDLLTALDNYQQAFYPLEIPSSDDIKRNLQIADRGVQEDVVIVGKALDEMRQWMKKEINSQNLRQIIENIFKKFPGEDNSFDFVIKTILKSCDKLNAISEFFTGNLTPQNALKMILLRLQSFNLPNREDSDAADDNVEPEPKSSIPMIHVAGWLELVWDRAPVLTILSFNDGIVPQSATSDLFLPNELRKELNILDNNRRFARDAYALTAIHRRLSSSGASSAAPANEPSKHLVVICGKTDIDGKSLLPSRLLFNKEKFALQAYRFFNDDKDNPLPKYSLKNDFAGNNPGKYSKEVWDWAERNLSGNVLKGVVKSISATKFKEYIQCPFRFFLKYVAGVQPTDYSVHELQAFSFGSVVHQVLQRWSQNKLDNKKCDWNPDVKQLIIELNDLVDEVFNEQYPDSVMPGILVQKEIIKQRLVGFAKFQSSWKGKTVAVEYENFVMPVQLSDNEEMILKGKIDRIDQLSDGTIILLDYKTSVNSPEKDHRDKDGAWINLQLPVYRYLFLNNEKAFLSDMKQRGVEIKDIQDVQVGYINISQDKDVDYTDSKWSSDDFEMAKDKMFEVMEDIHNGVFWPLEEDVKYDDYQDYIEWLKTGKELKRE